MGNLVNRVIGIKSSKPRLLKLESALNHLATARLAIEQGRYERADDLIHKAMVRIKEAMEDKI
jgi:hypothetical protein